VGGVLNLRTESIKKRRNEFAGKQGSFSAAFHGARLVQPVGYPPVGLRVQLPLAPPYLKGSGGMAYALDLESSRVPPVKRTHPCGFESRLPYMPLYSTYHSAWQYSYTLV
jgi:hypothetical protein